MKAERASEEGDDMRGSWNGRAKGGFFGTILLGLISTIAPPAATAANDPTTLRLLLWQAPTTLNPHFAQGIKDQTASRLIYEPLASFDREGNLVPFLAAEIP